jgi:hypothetical protein
LGVFYGGQDYETLLQDDTDNNTAHRRTHPTHSSLNEQ